MADKKYIITLYGRQWTLRKNKRHSIHWYYGGSRGGELNPEEFLIPTPKLSKAKTYDTACDARAAKDRIEEDHVPIVATITKKQLFEAVLKGI